MLFVDYFDLVLDPNLKQYNSNTDQISKQTNNIKKITSVVTKLHFLSPVLDSLFPIVMITGAGRAAGGLTIAIGCDLR
jgi:hypothetical protein